jgi:hypothetical protein
MRKGFINENDSELTNMGEELLSQINIEWEEGDEIIPLETKKIVLGKMNSEQFDEWWKMYPISDITYTGDTFKRTRTLRIDEDNCKIKFNKILNEGKYKFQELKDALLMEIEDRKSNSIRERTNSFKFMVGSPVYLNEKRFQSYVDEIRNGSKIIQNSSYDGVNG